MTPLSASLIFVLISVIVSLFRHVFFNSSNTDGNQNSNVSFSRLHTVTLTQNTHIKQPYNSLYQAYYKPEVPRQQSPLPYNSYALKKAVLNGEGVYLCDEKFAAVFEQRTACNTSSGSCKWKTQITVYRLPFLRKEESQTLEVEGKVLVGSGQELECRAKQIRWGSFELNFVMILNSREGRKGLSWVMHSLVIQQERPGWRRQSPLQVKLLKWNLKSINHYPALYSFDEKCLTYATREEPWLLHYNCANKWQEFNILSAQVQNLIFSKSNATRLLPPFSPSHTISPIFLRHFRSTQKIFFRGQGCGSGPCPRQQESQELSFITYAIQMTNSPLKFGKTFLQITISITNPRHPKFISFNIIGNNLPTDKISQLDCTMASKQYRLLKGLFSYQIGPTNEQNLVALLQKHSLTCIYADESDEVLTVVEIPDLIGNLNITQLPKDLLLLSKDTLQLRKLENTFYRRELLMRKKEEIKEDSSSSSWFDFDFFNFKYNLEQGAEAQTLKSDIDIDSDPEDDNGDKKEKKNRPKKKQEKKKGKKNSKERNGKEPLKFPQNPIGEKLEQLTDNFAQIGFSDPFEASSKTISFYFPFFINEAKLKLVNGDPQYPLIFFETTTRKYLLTYHPKEDEDSKGNSTQVPTYAYRFIQIGVGVEKHSEAHQSSDLNETIKGRARQEIELDRFLTSLLKKNENLMSAVKSIAVVDAIYDEGGRDLRLKGHRKPYCKQVIVAWGWGLEVYQVNWDKKGLRSQVAEIEQQLSHRPEGIEMATLLPFIQLFATVYCLFQAMITSR